MPLCSKAGGYYFLSHRLDFKPFALGTDSGGHSVDIAPSILSLLPEVVQNITRPIPILAAGGLVTGAHLASMLALGASGIVVGTRFSAATESALPQGKKERLIAAKSTSRDATVLSSMFDELLGGRHVWPPGTTARGLRMEAMLKDEEDGKSIEERRRIFETQNHSGGTHEIIWSGTGVGLINDIQSAEVSTRHGVDAEVS
jgi:nitronate monooxygenase